MIDKYKVLNNEKIQFDRYTEVKTDNEKMKNIMKSKIKSKKQVNKKLIVASVSATLVLGSVALTNERALAYINRLVNSIEYFLDRDSGEFDKYKFEGNQSLEKDGLILNLGDVMLDDKQLIVSLGIDYSNFDLEKNGFNKKDFAPDLPLITIGDMSFPGQGGAINQRNVRGEDKKEILYIVDLTRIDTDGDGVVDKDFDISERNIKCKLKIDDIRISPVSAKVKMDIEGDTSDNTYFFLSVTDENGKDLMNLDSGISDTENTVYCDFELKGTEEKIVITPVVCIDGNEKHLDDEEIEIEIP